MWSGGDFGCVASSSQARRTRDGILNLEMLLVRFERIRNTPNPKIAPLSLYRKLLPLVFGCASKLVS